MPALRVLQVHTRYREPGGEDAVVATEAALLRDAGHQVIQHVAENPPSAAGAAAALVTAPWNRAAARRLAEVAAAARPDVIHVHNTWFALSPAVVPALHGVAPVVMTLHQYRVLCANGALFRDGHPCHDCVGTHPWHGVRHRCYRSSVTASAAAAATIAVHARRATWHRDVDLFLALSASARDRFVEGGLPADRILVKPNVVSDPGPRTRRPSESSTVLYVGRLVPEKGVDDLLDAWAASPMAPLELQVVGDGPFRASLEARGIPGVTFLGARPADEVRRRMLDARALVFPSRWEEPFGLVVVEAMAAGTAVLARDTGGVAELVGRDGGWLVTGDGHPALAAALPRLHDGEAADAAGRAGRGRYEAGFTPAAGLAALEAAYAQAMAMRSQGRGDLSAGAPPRSAPTP